MSQHDLHSLYRHFPPPQPLTDAVRGDFTAVGLAAVRTKHGKVAFRIWEGRRVVVKQVSSAAVDFYGRRDLPGTEAAMMARESELGAQIPRYPPEPEDPDFGGGFPDIYENLFTELAALSYLSTLPGAGDHVARLLGHFRGDRFTWIVMEDCGSELLTWATEPGADLQRAARGAVQALHFVHASGIAHRDVSLENFLVDRRCAVKLVDFARAVEHGEHLRYFHPSGKAYTIAPEARRRGGYRADKLDVYALGVTLYTLFRKSHPWRNTVGLTDSNFRAFYLEKDMQAALVKHSGARAPLAEHPWLPLLGDDNGMLRLRPTDRRSTQQIVDELPPLP